MLNIDIGIFRFFNATLHSDALVAPVLLLTQFGTQVALFALALLLFLWKRTRKGGIYLCAGMAINYNIVDVLKAWIARPRPFEALPDVFLSQYIGGFSCPSGHTTNAFVAGSLCYFVAGGRTGRAALALAALVGLSRPWLGVHYPSDVLCGAALGSLIGWYLARVYREQDVARI